MGMSSHEVRRAESNNESDPYIEVERRLNLLERDRSIPENDESPYTGDVYDGHHSQFDAGYPGGSDPFVFGL